MTHPQLAELTQKVTEFARSSEDDSLVVYDPQRNAQVDYYFDDDSNPCLRLILTDPTPEELIGATALNLPEPQETSFQRRYGKDKGIVVRQLWYWIPVSDAPAAAELAISIMSHIQGSHPDAWFWITPISEPDYWPVPLPKPNVWPPNSSRPI